MNLSSREIKCFSPAAKNVSESQVCPKCASDISKVTECTDYTTYLDGNHGYFVGKFWPLCCKCYKTSEKCKNCKVPVNESPIWWPSTMTSGSNEICDGCYFGMIPRPRK